jgi:hypothetical protein
VLVRNVLGGVLVAGFVLSCGKTKGEQEQEQTPVDVLALAKVEAAKLTKRVAIEPFGLEASVPPDWTCERSKDDPTSCSKGYVTARWELEPLPADVDLAARARELEASSKQGGGESFYGRSNVAGFEGYLSGFRATKRPESWIKFDGWKDVPGHGKLRLIASVGSEGFDEVGWGAIVLSTRVGPSGIAASWSSRQELADRRNIQKQFEALSKDEGSPGEWIDGAKELAKRWPEDGGTARAASLVQGGEEAIRKLVVRRAVELATREDKKTARSAVILASTLRGWDDTACDAALDAIEKQLRASWKPDAFDHTREVSLAMIRLAEARTPDAQGAAFTRARTLFASSPANVFLSSDLMPVVEAALETAHPVMNGWVGACADVATRADLSVDHGRLAKLFTESRALAIPGVRRRVLSLLGEKTPYGSVTRRDNVIDLTWPHGSRGQSRQDGVGGTTMAMRVCDHYALGLRWSGAPVPFDALASERERDARIAELRTWVTSSK